MKFFLIIAAIVIVLGGIFLFARSSATMILPSIKNDVLDMPRDVFARYVRRGDERRLPYGG